MASFLNSYFSILIGAISLLFLSTSCSITRPTQPSPSIIPTSPQITVTAHATVTVAPNLPDEQLTDWKSYRNDSFGVSFLLPSNWYSPDVYEWEYGVRLEIGSDKVYPYGTDRLEQVYDVKNSYYIVIQYSKNNSDLSFEQYRQSQPWIETYIALLDLKDGESTSDIRDLAIRVRKVKLGRFEGLEYILTLSETAQTEFYYTRQVVLFDDEMNTLHITGTPNNVDIPNGEYWQGAYQTVDETNLGLFYKVLESITIE